VADFNKLTTAITEWQESTAWCVLKDPRTGEPIGGDKPARILMSSSLSERWLRMDKAYYSELRLAREQGKTTFTVDDVERFEQHRKRCYVAVTREWENIENGDEALACTPVNMEWLYSLKWVADQLLEFHNDLSNWNAPLGTESPLAADVMADSEKKYSIGASGTLQ